MASVFNSMDATFARYVPAEPLPDRSIAAMSDSQQRLIDTIRQERGRLGRFIRSRVDDAGDAEDLVQDVLIDLVDAWRLPEPIEQVGAWLMRVARNRIVDRFRSRRGQPETVSLDDAGPEDDEAEVQRSWLAEVLPSPEDGPEAAYERKRRLEQIAAALAELPEPQRAVFIAHEIDGRSFQALADESGEPLNTLLSRKRYAVLALRRRLAELSV